MRDTFIPQQRVLKLFQLITSLSRRKMTVREIGSSLGASERTGYRYIILLRELDFKVEVTGMYPSYYKITAWPDTLVPPQTDEA